MQIGITERGDAALNLDWTDWVNKGNPAILITKSPGTLADLVSSRDNIIVHATITGYGGTVVEPRVPYALTAITAYADLVKMLGPERVVLRIDPIIPTELGIQRAIDVLTTAKSIAPVERVRISFMDMYPHVKRRFKQAGLPIPYESLHAPKKRREIALNAMQRVFTHRLIEICGEPDLVCTGCVSDKDCAILGVEPSLGQSNQRPTCKCLSLKKELLNRRHPCQHGCLYCYWRD